MGGQGDRKPSRASTSTVRRRSGHGGCKIRPRRRAGQPCRKAASARQRMDRIRQIRAIVGEGDRHAASDGIREDIAGHATFRIVKPSLRRTVNIRSHAAVGTQRKASRSIASRMHQPTFTQTMLGLGTQQECIRERSKDFQDGHNKHNGEETRKKQSTVRPTEAPRCFRAT